MRSTIVFVMLGLVSVGLAGCTGEPGPPGPPGPAGPQGPAGPAGSGGDPMLGEIRFVAFDFAPRGWATCDGQLLAIAQHQALFSLLGTTYGGDGTTTFALPDMRSRSPVHTGQGPGLSDIDAGDTGGEETHTMTITELVPHDHSFRVAAEGPDEVTADDHLLGTPSSSPIYNSNDSGTPLVTMHNDAITDTGLGRPFNVRSPYLGVTCVIALQGIFPSRN